jgi:SPP1 family predicted phage head-tail adaptor
MAFLDIDAGRLTARLVLERPEAVEDGQGGAETGFVELARVWALIEPRSFAEEEKGPGLVSTVTHHVTVRTRGDLAVGRRFSQGCAGVRHPGFARSRRDGAVPGGAVP